MTETPGEREGRLIAAIPDDSYAHRLMLARAHAGHLSIREAAEKCGLNYASWANWERGARSRTMVDDADAIAEGLNVDRDWLLHGGPLTRPDRKRRIRATYFKMPSRPGERRRPRRIDRLTKHAA
jgi:transcriptional regulator with XRE-family HTH domain